MEFVVFAVFVFLRAAQKAPQLGNHQAGRNRLERQLAWQLDCLRQDEWERLGCVGGASRRSHGCWEGGLHDGDARVRGVDAAARGAQDHLACSTLNCHCSVAACCARAAEIALP